MKEQFIEKNMSRDSLSLVSRMNEIMANYASQGYDLSLRQLYYQLVSRNAVPNTEQSYKRVGSILSDARLAGLTDWDMIVDRGRETVENVHWDSPAEMVRHRAKTFQFDKWEDQPYHIEVMVEKQALEGVLQPVCARLDIPFTANKGYSSSSAMYQAGKRLDTMLTAGKSVCILYLGDHDPSGIDMTRDVEDRLKLFAGWHQAEGDGYVETGYYDGEFVVERVALNMEQVRSYNPPPNPAKLTDSRATGYITKFGRSSWELDALEPSVLASLVQEQVEGYRDNDKWDAAIEREKAARATLLSLADEADRRAEEQP